MSSQIDLSAVYIANAMGLVLLFVTMTGNVWRLKLKTRENRILLLMVAASITACIADPICFAADGKPGMLNFLVVFGGNTWIYAMNLLLGCCWLSFLTSYLGVNISSVHRCIIWAAYLLGAAFLVGNFFTPVVFSVSSRNVYARGPLFWYFMLMQTIMLLDGLGFYYRTRRKSGLLKFFPVWAFVLPAFLGMIIQMLVYGVSTVWPFVAISISSVMFSLQNELMFRDKLTGLYNRFYLELLKEKISAHADQAFTAMMLDVNDFKSINDRCGHAVGDEALVEVAARLRSAVGAAGEVIRYAGDEFIVLLNTQEDSQIDRTIAGIQSGLEAFNHAAKKSYKLSVSIGYSKLNLKEYTMDELLDETDQQMYANKRQYYEEHPKADRRRK